MSSVKLLQKKGMLIGITSSKVSKPLGYFEIKKVLNNVLDGLKKGGYHVYELDFESKMEKHDKIVIGKYKGEVEWGQYVLLRIEFVIEFDGKTPTNSNKGKNVIFGKAKMTYSNWIEFDWQGKRNKSRMYKFMFEKVFWPYFSKSMFEKYLLKCLIESGKVFGNFKKDIGEE